MNKFLYLKPEYFEVKLELFSISNFLITTVTTTTPVSQELKISITHNSLFAEETEQGVLVKVNEGSPLSIKCTVTGNFPELSVVVYKDSV